MHTVTSLVPEPGSFEVKTATENLNIYNYHVLINIHISTRYTLCCEIHKFITSIWNKEELPQQWKVSITAPSYKKGDKTGSNNCKGISLLPTTCKISSNILISRLTP
jgi:hypothetical protein